MRTRKACYMLMTDVPGTVAVCWGCGTPLAHFLAEPRVLSDAYRDARLVIRETGKDGLPRYGVRRGHEDLHTARGRAIHGPEIGGVGDGLVAMRRTAFYCNCPTCDRGQVVSPPLTV